MASIQDRFVRNLVSLDASATCADAARVMRAHRLGAVGVSAFGKVLGIFTERHLAEAAAAGEDLAETTLAQALPPDGPFVSPQATEAECAQLMRSRRTRHLAVKEHGEIVGVLSLLDVADLVFEEEPWSVEPPGTCVRGGRAGQPGQPTPTAAHHERASG